jgi:hypothetical protein
LQSLWRRAPACFSFQPAATFSKRTSDMRLLIRAKSEAHVVWSLNVVP